MSNPKLSFLRYFSSPHTFFCLPLGFFLHFLSFFSEHCLPDLTHHKIRSPSRWAGFVHSVGCKRGNKEFCIASEMVEEGLLASLGNILHSEADGAVKVSLA